MYCLLASLTAKSGVTSLVLSMERDDNLIFSFLPKQHTGSARLSIDCTLDSTLLTGFICLLLPCCIAFNFSLGLSNSCQSYAHWQASTGVIDIVWSSTELKYDLVATGNEKPCNFNFII